MKIEFANPGTIYNCLSSPSEEYGDDEEYDTPLQEKGVIIKEIEGDLMPMFHPLDRLGSNFKRIDESYSVCIGILTKTISKESNQKIVLDGLSKKFEKNLKNWISTSEIGEGYILGKGNESEISIIYDRMGWYSLYLGGGGTKIRKFPENQTEFIEEIMGLEKMVNYFVNYAMELPIKNPNREEAINLNINTYLSGFNENK